MPAPPFSTGTDIKDLLRAVCRTVELSQDVDVSTLLPAAQSITIGARALDKVLRILRLPSPIITISRHVKGFEGTFFAPG